MSLVVRTGRFVELEVGPYRPLTKQGSDDFVKYTLKVKIMEDRRVSIESAGKQKKCGEEVATDT